MILKKMMVKFWVVLKINKALSIDSNLNGETLFRLNNMKKTKDYFTTEIKERETMSNRLNKDNAAFDYIDKILIVLYATSGEISIFFFFLTLLEYLLFLFLALLELL